MPAALDLAPETHPVVAGAREIAVALDRMYAGLAEPLTAAEVPSVVADLDRIARRVEAVKLRVLAQGAASSAAADAGFASTGSWLAQQTRTTGRDAERQVRLADRLGSAMRTGWALAAGDLSAAHAAVVTDALQQLPDRVTAEQRSVVEAELVAKAARVDPGELRRAARRALAAVEPDRPLSTLTRTLCSPPRKKQLAPRPGSRCTTTATAPPQGTSPSPPWPGTSCGRSSTR